MEGMRVPTCCGYLAGRLGLDLTDHLPGQDDGSHAYRLAHLLPRLGSTGGIGHAAQKREELGD
jgi:hypothetical protein